eukprot:gb/GECG01006177.1/.p1 GENE.gb/GECG01006177.1/~~gb/GECG01006177.1/.p1  ORF type:complete len:281 (+),score=33.07 gb/GECG01006177.1/:1-843(+)
MEPILSAVYHGVKKFYNAVKDYSCADRDAKGLANRLKVLQRTLDRITTEDEMVVQALEHAQETINSSFDVIHKRVIEPEEARSVSGTLKKLVQSSADRHALTEASHEIREVTGQLHFAVAVQTNTKVVQGIGDLRDSQAAVSSGIDDLQRALRRDLHCALDWQMEMILKQFRGEFQCISLKQEISVSTQSNPNQSSAGMESHRSRAILKTLPRVAWRQLEWEDGIGPTPEDPKRSLLKRGGFGFVYQAYLKHVGDMAVKIFDMEPSDIQDLEGTYAFMGQ